MIFWTALTLGFFASFHCVGMCGPIALAIPVNRKSRSGIFSGIFIYNTGRVFTYALAGAVFGMAGKGIALTGLQDGISIAAGSILLLSVLLPKLFPARYGGRISSLFIRIKNKLGEQFSVQSRKSLFIIGLLNGLLPCGLVYIAAIASLTTGDPLTGAIFMMSFGAGTMPAMMTLSIAGNYCTPLFRKRILSLTPVLTGVVAVLLIMRGLSLGIPYISPETDLKGNCHHNCCTTAVQVSS